MATPADSIIEFLDQAAAAFNEDAQQFNGKSFEDVSADEQLELMMSIGRFVLANYQATRAALLMSNGNGTPKKNGKTPAETTSSGGLPKIGVKEGKITLWRWKLTPDEAREVGKLLIVTADRLDNK